MSDTGSVGTTYTDIEPRLSDDFEKKLVAKLTPVMDKISAKMGALGKSMTTKVTLPLVGIATVSVIQAQKVASGLREVNSLFGLTGAEGEKSFNMLKTGVAGLSKELGVAQDVLIGGLYQAISKGVPKENVFDFMRVATKAGVAGVTDTETAVNGLTSTINAFGLKATDAQRVADSMFTTVTQGGTTFEELSSSLFNIAPAAAAAHVSFTEVNAAMATMTKSGVPTSVATTQLRAALVGLQRPSEDLDKIFGKLGYKNAQAAIEAKGMGYALGVVRDAAGGSNGKLQTLLGSVEAVSAANIIGGTGAEDFANQMKKQGEAAGATDKAFAELDKSRAMQRLKTNLQNLAIQVGDVLIPVITKMIDKITPWIEKFSNLSDHTKNVIITIGALVAALGPVLLVTSKIIKAVEGLINVGTKLWKAFSFISGKAQMLYVKLQVLGRAALNTAKDFVKAAARMVWSAAQAVAKTVASIATMVARWVFLGVQSLLSAAKVAAAWILSLGPIAWVIAAVVAAVAIIIKNWDTIKNAILTAVHFVLDWLKNNWPMILAILTGPIGLAVLAIVRNWDTIKDAMSAVKQWIIDRWNDVVAFLTGIPGAIWGALQTAWNAVQTAAGAVKQWIMDKWNELMSFLGGIPGRVGSALAGVWNGITNGITAAKQWVVDRLNDLVNAVRGIGSGIASAATGMWDGIKNAFRATINWILKGWNALEFKMPEVDTHIPGVGKVGGFTVGVPDIPLLAKGGIGRGVVLTSELGPELLDLGSVGTRVTSHDDLMSALGESPTGGGDVNYNLALAGKFGPADSLIAQFDRMRRLSLMTRGLPQNA